MQPCARNPSWPMRQTRLPELSCPVKANAGSFGKKTLQRRRLSALATEGVPWRLACFRQKLLNRRGAAAGRLGASPGSVTNADSCKNQCRRAPVRQAVLARTQPSLPRVLVLGNPYEAPCFPRHTVNPCRRQAAMTCGRVQTGAGCRAVIERVVGHNSEAQQASAANTIWDRQAIAVPLKQGWSRHVAKRNAGGSCRPSTCGVSARRQPRGCTKHLPLPDDPHGGGLGVIHRLLIIAPMCFFGRLLRVWSCFVLAVLWQFACSEHQTSCRCDEIAASDFCILHFHPPERCSPVLHACFRLCLTMFFSACTLRGTSDLPTCKMG